MSPASPALASRFFTTSATWEAPLYTLNIRILFCQLNLNKAKEKKVINEDGLTQETVSPGTFLVVLWLGLWASTAGHVGSILGQATKIPCARWFNQKKETVSPNLGILRKIMEGPGYP